MSHSFRRPPAGEPPAIAPENDAVGYVPEGAAQSALASVKRIARAIPHRKVLRKAGNEVAGELGEEGEKADQEKEQAPPIKAKLEGVGRKVFLAADPNVPRLPVPAVPPGCSGLSDFGTRVMIWGTGDAEARARMATVTKDEMVQAGVTADLAQAWTAFYENEATRNPDNPSAKGRADLMRQVAKLVA